MSLLVKHHTNEKEESKKANKKERKEKKKTSKHAKKQPYDFPPTFQL